MIPKRAFFLWVGEDEMPWLRQLSVDSFKKFNPDWEVDLIRVPPNCEMVCAQATDVFRYSELATRGGLYLDTDIVFFRPVPDDVLDADVAVTIDKGPLLCETNPQNELLPGFTNLAFLGSAPDSKFFKYVYDKSMDRVEALSGEVDMRDPKAYQVLGVNLLNRLFYTKNQADIEAQFDCKINNVPLEVVLPIPWYSTHKLFNGTPFEPGEETIGAHWYGDCIDARRYCKQVTLDNYKRRPCYLADAIDRALA